MSKQPNCTVIIERIDGKKIKQDLFWFDDYRVAIALSNILNNINDVHCNHNEYKNFDYIQKIGE